MINTIIQDKYNQSSQNSKQYQKNISQSQSSTAENPRSTYFFHTMACNPQILQNKSNISFSQDLYANKIIKTIIKYPNHILITLAQKKNHKTFDMVKTYQFENHQLYQQINQLHQCLGNIFLQNSINSNTSKTQLVLQQLHDHMEKMKNKYLIAWALTYSQKGPKLRHFALTIKTLNLLNYKPNQFQLDVINLGAQAFDILNGPIFKQTFLTVIKSFKKFYQVRTNQSSLTKQQILKQSQKSLKNEIKGKDNKKITVQTKISMVSQNIACHQIIKIIDQKIVKDYSLLKVKQKKLFKIQKNNYKCLQGIIKIPQIIYPINANKVCGYKLIKRQVKYKKKIDQQYTIS